MFEVYPDVSLEFVCPACKYSKIKPSQICWQGIHLLADCQCPQCQLLFYHTCPVGHALLFPLAFAQKEHSIFPSPHAGQWFYQPLFHSYYSTDFIEVPVQSKIYRHFSRVVILNCLDSVYGHTLLRLLNAQKHLTESPEIGVIILLPQPMEWLVPEDVAEVWTVTISFADTKKWVSNLNDFVQEQLPRFEKVYISHAFVHPDWNHIDISLFTGMKPFAPENFYAMPLQIVFLWREDRFWTRYVWEEWLFKVSVKTKLQKQLRWFFLARQTRLFAKTARFIRHRFPAVHFLVIGLGKTGHLPKPFTDKRSANPDEKIEREWCELYAQSQLVIGIHGSHMLLPTALASGFIELVPSYRLHNFGEAVACRYPNRMQLFLGRFLPVFSSPKQVAAHAIQIISDFSWFQRMLKK